MTIGVDVPCGSVGTTGFTGGIGSGIGSGFGVGVIGFSTGSGDVVSVVLFGVFTGTPTPAPPLVIEATAHATALPSHTNSSVIVVGVVTSATVTFLFSDTNVGLLIVIISLAHLLYSAR